MLAKLGIASYIESPDQFRFETQQVDESIVLILRPHWVTLIKKIAIGLILFLIPIIIESLLTYLSVPVEMRWQMRLSFWIFWESISAFYLVCLFLLWYFSCDIVTTKRIIDINFQFPFYRKVSETSLIRIQDISNVSNGFFQSLFNYGDVRVETAGETSHMQITLSPTKTDSDSDKHTAAALPNFMFEAVPKPDVVQKKVLELITALKGEQNV